MMCGRGYRRKPGLIHQALVETKPNIVTSRFHLRRVSFLKIKDQGHLTLDSSSILLPLLGLFGISCVVLSGQEYHVEKKSPNGLYRVTVELRHGKPTGTLEYTEQLKIQYIKGQEIIGTYETVNSDQYEDSLREGVQVVEWVADNVLRIGRDRSDQPFNDELIVSNNTEESIKYFGVSYGKYESFRVFDLPPKSQVRLRASPEFKPDRSSNYFLGYGGRTQSGKKFEGTMEAQQRKSPADGPLKFNITIKTSDLR